MRSRLENKYRFVLWGVNLLMLLAVACQANSQKRKSEFVAHGEKYLAAGEPQNAIIEYKRALRIDPRSAELEYKLGQAYFSNHQSREAFLAYRKATEFNPDYVPARLALGQFSLLFLGLVEAHVIESKLAGQVRLPVPRKQRTRLGHVPPFRKPRSPPLVILGNGVKLRKIERYDFDWSHYS